MSLFVKEESNGILRILCPSVLDVAAAKVFVDSSKQWMITTTPTFALDMVNVVDIHREFYKVLMQVRAALKRDGKYLFSVHLSAKINRQIVADGMVSAFHPVKSFEDLIVKEEKPKAPPAMDAVFINQFLTATVKTFQVQCRTELKPLKPYIKNGVIAGIAIAGVINLTSTQYSGSVVLCFPEKVFLKVYENMFDEKLPTINEEAEDAAGELLNIIYGAAKVGLNEKGFDFQKALPTILKADGLSVRQSGGHPIVVMPFETSEGVFHMEFELRKGANNV